MKNPLLVTVLSLAACIIALYAVSANDYLTHDKFCYSYTDWRTELGLFIQRSSIQNYGVFVPRLAMRLLCIDVFPLSILSAWHRVHLLHILLHILNAWMVVLVLRTFLKDALLVGVCALIFAAHPINSEAVAGTAIADLLCTTFYLAAMLAFLSFRRRQRPGRYLLSLFCFCLALLSKEMALSLPLALALYELLLTAPPAPGKKEGLKHWIAYLPFWLLAIAYLIPRLVVPGYFGYGYIVQGRPAFYWVFRDMGVMRGLALYAFRLATIPYRFFLFPFNAFVFSGQAQLIRVAMVVAVGLPLMLGLLRSLANRFQRKVILFAAGFVFFSCVPFFSIIDSIDYNAGGLINSRYFYLPSIGFGLLFGASLWQFSRGLIRAAVFVCALVFYALLLLGNNIAWSEATELCASIPAQAKLLHPLAPQEDKTFYFLPEGDELYFHKGIPTFQLHNALVSAFTLTFGFPVKAYIIDPPKLAEDVFYSRAPADMIAQTQGFDLRDAAYRDFVLRWNTVSRKVESLNEPIIEALKEEAVSFRAEYFLKERPQVSSSEGRTVYSVALPVSVPLGLIGAVEIGLEGHPCLEPGLEAQLFLGEDQAISFNIPQDAQCSAFSVPVRLRRLEDIRHRVEGVTLVMSPPPEKAAIAYLRLCAYPVGRGRPDSDQPAR